MSSIIHEEQAFEKAVSLAQQKINILRNEFSSSLSQEELGIYDAHIEIINDPELKEKTLILIRTKICNADYALSEVFNEFALLLEELDDPYLKERSQDIRMLSRMLILFMQGKEDQDISLNTPSILAAEYLTTNQLAELDHKLIKGIITAKGGVTDHVAILSKALNIPTLIGVGKKLKYISNQDLIIIDSQKSLAIINPNPQTIEDYKKQKEILKNELDYQIRFSNEKAISKSGKHIAVHANIGSIEDSKMAKSFGADGIGLLRSELCFLETKSFPNEEDQYKKYKEIISLLPDAEHTIRLVDFGTDKKLSYLKIFQEENPAMGLRALRLGFKYYNELLRPQIRALLRLSELYNIKLLCPMIATPDDFNQIKNAIQKEFKKLLSEGFKLKKIIPIGIMVEVPNVAFRPELFVNSVDFFSFGTNDLAQFLMAADRTNDNLINYLDQAEESMLLLIESFTKIAHQYGKKVSICGELASKESCVPAFLKMGIDALSVPPALIPNLKSSIRKSI